MGPLSRKVAIAAVNYGASAKRDGQVMTGIQAKGGKAVAV